MSLGVINVDIDSVERTSADKQRNDSTVTCHGFLSLFCHDVESGRIVRLDKQVEWELQPKKKLYSERPFPTAEQRAAAQQQLEAAMEEMKKCPMPQSPSAAPTAAPDTSQCQLSSPVLNVNTTDEHADDPRARCAQDERSAVADLYGRADRRCVRDGLRLRDLAHHG